MNCKTSIILFLLLTFSLTNVFSQTYVLDGTDIVDCTGFFLDSGGGIGEYSNNENFEITLCPDFVTGTHVQLTFSAPEIAPGDQLCFFDGNSTAEPTLGCASDFTPGSAFIIQASAVNPTGCLTVTFNSDGNATAQGWEAQIRCIAACQIVESILLATDPPLNPADTGWIDVCPGEPINFFAEGYYPQSGQVYTQSDFSSDFTWDFGDGTNAIGLDVNHSYAEPGGYIVQLLIQDTFQCRSTNFLNIRVRVSTPPEFTAGGTLASTICAGDTINLSSNINSVNGNSNISVVTTEGSFANFGVLSDTIDLPDGNGASYSTSIFFGDFSPGQVLTDINDFLGVCVNMEHSYMHDLQITLECPNGTNVMLQNQTFLGEVFLGEPNESDVTNQTQGVGYDYCWTPNATNGTWTEYDIATNVGTLPAGDYNSFQPLSGFIGCPLNGEWTITVTDLLAIDDGWLFQWSVGFDEDLYPVLETFQPAIFDFEWLQNPTIFEYSGDSTEIAAAPQNAGTAEYQFRITDDFGCLYDTSLLVTVLPSSHPNCFACDREEVDIMAADLQLCSGDSTNMLADVLGALGDNDQVIFEAFPNFGFTNPMHPPGNPFESDLNINSISPAIIVDATTTIQSVCVNIETRFAGDVELWLRSPDGQILELTTDNGGSGDDFINTCFTPSATVPINSGSAPFTGDFQPEGNWSVFDGSPTNGNWTILIADDAGLNDVTSLIDWQITFSNNNSLTYDWQVSPDLSCLDCPDPVVTPSMTTTYEVTVTNAFNCSAMDDITIGVVNSFDAPVVGCIGEGNDNITFGWPAVPSATSYEFSLDGGTTWQPTTGTTTHDVAGLVPGDMVDIMVRVDANPNCVSSGAATCTFIGCSLQISVGNFTPPQCYNTPDGVLGMTGLNGSSPITYSVDGAAFVTSPITGVLAGDHEIIALDNMGCRDTIMYTLTGPDSILLSTTIDSVSCNGAGDGEVMAQASGGSGILSFTWNTIPATFNATASALDPGSYTVTVTDASFCTAVETVTVEEPANLIVSVGQIDSVNCFGGNDGSASATAVGGTAPYQFTWPGPIVGPNFNGQMAGNYDVTVTDFNLCQDISSSFDIFEPAVLVVNLDSTDISCPGSGDGTVIANVMSGGTNPFSFSWAGPAGFTSNFQNPTGLQQGTYCVTVTDFNNCNFMSCTSVNEPTAIQLMPVSTTPDCFMTPTGTATVIVSGGDGNYDFQWDAAASSQTDSIAQGLLAGNYDVVVTDGTNCSETIQVTVNPAPQIFLTMDSTVTECVGSADGTATANPTGGVGTFSYLWDDPLGQTTQTAINLVSGTYCVIVTDQSMCTATRCVDVTTPNPLMITSEIETPVSCFGRTDGQALVNVQGGTGPGTYSFVWDDPLAQFLNPAVNLSANTYMVTVSDGNMCTAIGNVTVTQPDSLFVTIDSTDVSCFGGFDGTATAMENGGVSPYSFVWSDSQMGAMATDFFAGTYSVIVTDGNTCTAEQSVTINEPSMALSATINQTVVGCFGATDGEALAEGMGGVGPYSYMWNNNAGNNDLAINLDSLSYTVTVMDSNQCTAEESISIDQLPEIELNLQLNEPSCFGESDGQAGVTVLINGMVQNSNDYSYSWNTTPTQSSPVAFGLVGNQSYTVTVTDQLNCSAIESRNMDEPSLIQLAGDGADVSCFGLNDGIASITSAQGDHNEYTYLWDINARSQTTSDADSLFAGSYSVTVTDSTGCQVDTIIVIDQPSRINVELTTSDNNCNNTEMGTIFASASGGTPNYEFLWETGGTADTLGNLSIGTYSLTVSDENGCMLVDSADINSPEVLEAFINSTPVTCFGDRDGSIIIEAVGGTPPYMYSLDGESYGGASTLIGLTEGIYDVFIRDFNDCIFEDQVNVRGPLEYTVNAGNDLSINLGDSIRLDFQVDNPGGGTVFTDVVWSAPYEGTLECSPLDLDCSGPWATPQTTITYTVMVTDGNGCVATDDIEITVIKERDIFVATGFTPNSDGANDELIIHGKPGVTINLYRIFDRWGELVYEQSGFELFDPLTGLPNEIGWDGNFRGKEMPPGVYVWYIEAEYIDGHKQLFKGQSTLLR